MATVSEPRKLTEAQRRHLEWLAGEGPEPKHKRAGFYCRVNGWSEWLWRLTDGSEATNSEVAEMAKPLPPERCLSHVIREILTPAGRAALEGRDDG